MSFQIACGLDVLLTGGLVLGHHPAVLLDVAPLLPIAQHAAHVALVDALAEAHELGFLTGEHLGKEVEQVLRSPRLEGVLALLFLTTDGLAEELHLTPHVVT